MRDALAGFADDQVGVAELLVSELATNAIVHAESMLIVHVEVSAGGFKVSVEDCSYVEPMPRWDVPDDSPGGRGLLWVDAMADSWGWERTETGKLVWFALASDSS
jgi:anti-sigma regulatory factor (Ser/Thr protein kinase)